MIGLSVYYIIQEELTRTNDLAESEWITSIFERVKFWNKNLMSESHKKQLEL